MPPIMPSWSVCGDDDMVMMDTACSSFKRRAEKCDATTDAGVVPNPMAFLEYKKQYIMQLFISLGNYHLRTLTTVLGVTRY